MRATNVIFCLRFFSTFWYIKKKYSSLIFVGIFYLPDIIRERLTNYTFFLLESDIDFKDYRSFGYTFWYKCTYMIPGNTYICI